MSKLQGQVWTCQCMPRPARTKTSRQDCPPHIQVSFIVMRKIRTAMFGTGFMGKVHTEAIRRLGNVEVSTVAASSQSTADRFASALGITHARADWRAVLADKEIDAVHVCTPNALHYPMVKAALEAGKHVLC